MKNIELAEGGAKADADNSRQGLLDDEGENPVSLFILKEIF